MSVVAHLRPSVLAAKQKLADGRARIAQRHEKGSPGIQVSGALADLLDTVMLGLVESALEDLGEAGPQGLAQHLCLVAHSGYGRRDVAPYSDVDLMLLYAPQARSRVVSVAERLMRDVFDAGLVLGHSVRTIGEACQQAAADPTIWTGLVESRRLYGSSPLFERLQSQFHYRTRRLARRILPAVLKARDEERTQYGETVYLLEPNVKRSRGGLRDLQLLRWVGYCCYETTEIDGLQLRGLLSPADQRRLRDATELLLRIRNELHFHAGKAADVFTRSEQVRLAELYKYQGQAGLLPVEQFMRDYFRASDDVSRIVMRLVENATSGPRWWEWFGPLVSHQVEGDFWVGPREIVATRRGLLKLRSNANEILRLVDLANLYDKRIAQSTREAIRAAAPQMSSELGREAASRFLSLLGQPARLGELLRFLHETAVLEKIIPGFAHARSLLQFNEYHKYTVDEHCLRAVERCTEFAADRGPLGRTYGRVRRKAILHLALLIHDLGKGLPGDHSDVGREIAAEVASRLYLNPTDTEDLKFLVHKHLLMSHLAFRRDTSDEQLVVRLAVEVGSPELLRMLYLLTAADFAAVGPGVWNDWKAEVLTDLYRRGMARLGDETATARAAARLEGRRSQVLAALAGEADAPWFQRQIASLPETYLQATPPTQLAVDLQRLHTLRPGDVWAQGRYSAETHVLEYTVATHEDITPGVFHRLAGALAARGLQVLGADINTLADGLVLDRFFVQDTDYSDEPPASRLREVEASLRLSLQQPDDAVPAFRRVWRPSSAAPIELPAPPTRVQVDNTSSDRYTIIDVFTADRTGLLYGISRALFELGLSVSVAKIATYQDQVVDVFYVADVAGAKLTDQERLDRIRHKLITTIESLDRALGDRATVG